MQIVWFRQDLRLADNPALVAAAQKGAVLPCYILDDITPKQWKIGGASRWWLHHSLAALIQAFEERRVPFILRFGNPEEELLKLCKEVEAEGVCWNRCYEPYAIERDTKLKKVLSKKGIEVQTFNGSLLFEPWEINTKQASPFKVFTPFWKACNAKRNDDVPLGIPKLSALKLDVYSEKLSEWRLAPKYPNWAKGFEKVWMPGEAGAQMRLKHFIANALSSYADARDFPSIHGTSMLSPHLHYGEISPRTILYIVQEATYHAHMLPLKQVERFLSEIGWREFSYHLLYHYPELPTESFVPAFKDFPWGGNANDLIKWQKGLTGYPIVDAGMRELWHTGYMHNRVRMVVASFLTKHLLISWEEGAKWFWDTLVDADLANNSASWQWVAGCGADAAPYFRIFNPILQGEKFDKDGNYIKMWVPELKNLSASYIHAPWKAPESVLEEAGIKMGKSYPMPIVDHGMARDRALAIYKKLKK